jgi:P27 family predicted phage terminase small subunit
VTGEGRKEWSRITAELAKMDLLKVTDRAALAAYCMCYSRWVAAEKAIKSKGMTYKANGLTKINPLVRVAQDTLSLMKAYLIEFGLTPASRTRIKTPEAPKANPLGDLLDEIARGN